MRMFAGVGLLALGISGFGSVAQAVTIGNGTIQLGVDGYGQLITPGGAPAVGGTTDVGLRWTAPEGQVFDGLSHGCLCEGWGVSASTLTAKGAKSASGWANDGFAAVGTSVYGLTQPTTGAFTSDASTATTVAQLRKTDLTITHNFAPSDKTPNLYAVTVTLANTGAAAINDIVYRRVMDWDTSPTVFNELVSIVGTAKVPELTAFSNDGMSSSNPNSLWPMLNIGNCGTGGDFVDCSVNTALNPSYAGELGAAFDFSFGTLGAGEVTSFTFYYGVAGNVAGAKAAIAAVGAPLYSLARSALDGNGDGFSDTDPSQRTPTFIFAYGSGDVPDLPAVPLPAGITLLMGGLGALAALKRRRNRA